jgi:hypothetical protein
LRIADASVSEGNVGTRSMIFTIEVDRAHVSLITARVITADQTARAGSDYSAVNTVVSLPAGVNQTTVSVPVIGDTRREGNETFLARLGTPTNATIARDQATGTIVDDDGVVGTAELVSGSGVIAAEEIERLTLHWTHPDHWRDLHTVDLRVLDDDGVVFWARFTEGADRFSLCIEGACGGSFAPGAGDPVSTGEVIFYPSESALRGSGPTGASVDLTFAVSFNPSTIGRSFRVEAAAMGDNGDAQSFEPVGLLVVSSGGDDGGCRMTRDGAAGPGLWWPCVVAFALALRAGAATTRNGMRLGRG